MFGGYVLIAVIDACQIQVLRELFVKEAHAVQGRTPKSMIFGLQYHTTVRMIQ